MLHTSNSSGTGSQSREVKRTFFLLKLSLSIVIILFHDRRWQNCWDLPCRLSVKLSELSLFLRPATTAHSSFHSCPWRMVKSRKTRKNIKETLFLSQFAGTSPHHSVWRRARCSCHICYHIISITQQAMHISLDFLSYRLSVVCLLSTEVWSDVMRYGDGTLKGGEYRACHRQSAENLLTVDLTTVSFSSLSSSQLITVSVVPYTHSFLLA